MIQIEGYNACWIIYLSNEHNISKSICPHFDERKSTGTTCDTFFVSFNTSIIRQFISFFINWNCGTAVWTITHTQKLNYLGQVDSKGVQPNAGTPSTMWKWYYGVSGTLVNVRSPSSYHHHHRTNHIIIVQATRRVACLRCMNVDPIIPYQFQQFQVLVGMTFHGSITQNCTFTINPFC